MDADNARSPSGPSRAFVFLSAIAPFLLLLAGLIWWFFHGGSELIDRPIPPIEQISIRRVELKPGEFKLTIRNTGPMPVDMTLVTVDEAIWKAEFSPSRRLERLEEAISSHPIRLGCRRPLQDRTLHGQWIVIREGDSGRH